MFYESASCRVHESSRRVESASPASESASRPYRQGPKSIPYFSNFWALFSGSGHYLSVEKSPRVNESTSRRVQESVSPRVGKSKSRRVHESRQRVGKKPKF